MRIYLSIVLFFLCSSALAQRGRVVTHFISTVPYYDSATFKNLEFSGVYFGYEKRDTFLHLKTNCFAGCGNNNSTIYNGNFLPTITSNRDTAYTEYDDLEFFNRIYNKNVIVLNNVDSSSKSIPYDGIGHVTLRGGQTTGEHLLAHHPSRCNDCLLNTYPNSFKRNYFEYSNDSVFDFYPIKYGYPIVNNPPSIPASMQSLTVFHGEWDLINDSLSWTGYRNIAAPVLIQPYFHNRSIIYSRIYHYQDYTKLSAPVIYNRFAIVGLRGQTITFAPAFIDAENDSISVTPLWMKISGTPTFHPLNIQNPYYQPLTPAQQISIKKGIKDSVINLPYRSGHSYTNPFGIGSSYTLDAATGQLSFNCSVPGLYYLAYRLSEYRNGVLLGDNMVYRTAYIMDSVATLPTLSEPTAINGAVWDAAQRVMRICPGKTMGFTLGANSNLPQAKLIFTDVHSHSMPASTAFIAGGGTAVVQAVYSWTPSLADTGWHYFWYDVIDTNCSSTELPVHQSKAFRIYVTNSVIVNLGNDTLVCKNALTTWQLNAANAGSTYLWNTMQTTQTINISPFIQTIPYGQTGKVWLRVTSSIGCSASDTINITVLPVPVVSTINNTHIAFTYYFNSNATNATSYNWSFGDGGTAVTTTPTHTYTLNGTYNVRVIATNSCGSDTAYTTIIISGLGVQSAGLEESRISVYPNPATSNVIIKSEGLEQLRLVKILNEEGLLVKTVYVNNTKETLINLKGYATGMYILNITTNKGLVTRKVFIK